MADRGSCGVRVEAGEIRVASVDLVVDEPTAKVWHVDLDSKYAEVLAYSADEVLLCAGDRTLKLDESLRGKPTALELCLPDDWEIVVDCARYTCRVLTYRPRRDKQ